MGRSELCELSSAIVVNETESGILCCIQFVPWFLQSDRMWVLNIISSRTNAEAWQCVDRHSKPGEKLLFFLGFLTDFQKELTSRYSHRYSPLITV